MVFPTRLQRFDYFRSRRITGYPSILVQLKGSRVPVVHLSPFVERIIRQAARMRVDASLSQRAREEWGVWRQASSGDRDSRFSRSLATRLGRLILLCMITFRHSRDKSNCVQGEKRPVLCFTSFSNLSNCSLINFR